LNIEEREQTMQVDEGSKKSFAAGARYCVAIALDPLVEMGTQLQDFPLRSGEF